MTSPLPSQTSRTRVAILSIVAGCFILGLKYYAYHVSQSTALKSDAIENVVNVVAAVFALGAIIFAGKPADREHPYGHGKIEHFSAVFEGGMISLAAVLIFYEALQAVVDKAPLQNLSLGLGINFLAGVFNGLLGLYLIHKGKQQNSHALIADGHHVLSDFYVTLGLGGGLLLVKVTGLHWLDPVLAVLVGAILAWTGFKLVRASSAALMDTEDPGLVEHLVTVINAIRPLDVLAIHELRTLRSGRYTHVDIHVVIPEFYTIAKGHELAERFNGAVVEAAAIEGELHTHVDPCHQEYCPQCAVEACPLRLAPKTEDHAITLEQALSPGTI